MSKYKVVVVNLGYESYQVEQEILKPINAELILAPNDCLTENDVISVAKGADAILVREAPISAKVLDSLNRCKVIARYGVGVDNINLEVAKQKKIYVANAPGYGTEEVSDHAVALLLTCIRKLLIRDQTLRQGKFEMDINDTIYRTTGKTLGIIGYGQIGRAFHRKWKGFLLKRVLVFDPYVAPEIIQENGAKRVDLDTLFAESDYISLHTSLSPETRYIIDEAALRKMKQTAIVVNTSRGELIDEDALIRGLKEGWILAAGLDVFEKEPLSQNHPLLKMSNVVLTGHVAWYSKDSVRELQTRAAHEVLRVLSGKTPICWVNKW